jgi:hypothetical protein
MFRLYVRCHHQAGYRTLNEKNIKINTITFSIVLHFHSFLIRIPAVQRWFTAVQRWCSWLRHCGTAVVQLVEALRYSGGAVGWGTAVRRWCSWLRHCAGAIPKGVIGIRHWLSASCRTNGNEYQEYFLGCQGIHVPIVLKSGSLKLLQHARPLQGLLDLYFYISV